MKTEKELDIYFYIAGWIVAAAILIYALLPGFGDCLFHSATGYYCPGCGGTRALYAFFQGHPLLSAFYHPFVPYALLTGGYFMISQTVERISRHKIAIALHFRAVYLWIGLALIVINFLIKNAAILFFGNSLLD